MNATVGAVIILLTALLLVYIGFFWREAKECFPEYANKPGVLVLLILSRLALEVVLIGVIVTLCFWALGFFSSPAEYIV